MFDTILGLPVHPLVIHGVVVLLPLAALLTIVVSVRSQWRQRFAWPIAVLNAGVTGLALVAKESGEALLARMPGLDISTHEGLGRTLVIMAFGLTAASVLLALAGTRTALARVATVLSIAAAVLVLVWTVRAGHSGAEAVWGSRF